MRKTSLDCVYELAKKDKRIIFVGSDLGPGVLDDFKKNIPDRFFMEGVAEQYIIGMSAGLAKEGFIPYVNTISTFITRRCYEQVAIDLCLHNLPVRLIGNGGGLVYAPLGPTHLAIEDISLMRSIPNMTIISPCDANEMKNLMMQTANYKNPIYIRLGRGGEEVVTNSVTNFEIGKGILLKKPKEVLIISCGTMTQKSLKVSNILSEQNIEAGVLHINTIKPIDQEKIINNSKNCKLIVTLEEHLRTGGLGSSVLECINDNNKNYMEKVLRIGLEDKFPEQYGNQQTLQDASGLSDTQIVKKILLNLK
jgi:transketolase